MFKIYIGNLENSVTLDEMKELMAPFTDIEDLVLVMDPQTGESRCFAIAMFRDQVRGQLVIETINGHILKGRPIVANESVKKRKGLPPKKAPPSRGGGGGMRGMSGMTGLPSQSGGMNRGMSNRTGMGDGPPRIPSRPPSGRPSSRPTSRGNVRRDFGSAAPGVHGSDLSGSPAGANYRSPQPFRPGGSSGFSRTGLPVPGAPASPPLPPPASSPADVNRDADPDIKPDIKLDATPVAPTARTKTPKPPSVRRADSPATNSAPKEDPSSGK